MHNQWHWLNVPIAALTFVAVSLDCALALAPCLRPSDVHHTAFVHACLQVALQYNDRLVSAEDVARALGVHGSVDTCAGW